VIFCMAKMHLLLVVVPNGLNCTFQCRALYEKSYQKESLHLFSKSVAVMFTRAKVIIPWIKIILAFVVISLL